MFDPEPLVSIAQTDNSDSWRTEPNFGILRDDWDGIDWSKKKGYDDFKKMISKY